MQWPARPNYSSKIIVVSDERGVRNMRGYTILSILTQNLRRKGRFECQHPIISLPNDRTSPALGPKRGHDLSSSAMMQDKRGNRRHEEARDQVITPRTPSFYPRDQRLLHEVYPGVPGKTGLKPPTKSPARGCRHPPGSESCS